jgi:hypothetical protein
MSTAGRGKRPDKICFVGWCAGCVLLLVPGRSLALLSNTGTIATNNKFGVSWTPRHPSGYNTCSAFPSTSNKPHRTCHFALKEKQGQDPPQTSSSPSSSTQPSTGNILGGGGKARFVGFGESSSTGGGITSFLDGILRIVLSDVGNIVIGSIALGICLVNRVFYTDALFSSTDSTLVGGAAAMGQQSRADLLAVFAAMAVLLNGVTKLDVTSALAETVELEGIDLEKSVEWIAYNRVEENLVLSRSSTSSESSVDETTSKVRNDMDQFRKRRQTFEWALQSVLESTPASTAVLMVNSKQSQAATRETQAISTWLPSAFAGIVPAEPLLRCVLPKSTKTPILDRFLGYSENDERKESYLPTLQALPGKVEFTYLPPNTQSALLVPIQLAGGSSLSDGTSTANVVLVLGGDTAKNFTPRDIAWVQVITARLQDLCFNL